MNAEFARDPLTDSDPASSADTPGHRTTSIPEAGAILGPDFTVLHVSERAGRDLGIDPHRVVGRKANLVLPPFAVTGVWLGWRRVLETGKPVRFRRHDPERDAWWRIRIEPVAEGVAVTFRPASEAAPQSPPASEDLFRTLVDRLIVAVYLRRGRRLEYANPKAATFFGHAADHLVDQIDFVDLFHIGDRPKVDALVGPDGRGTLGPSPHLLRTGSTAGTRELEVYEIPTRGDATNSFLGVAIDITEATRTTTALREREEQLRHAQKLEAVGRLAGGIAHDFNNLLMVIQGSANLILMNEEEPIPDRGDLEEIVRATRRAASLTGQLLAFSRKQVLRPKVIDLNASVENLHKMLRRVIGEDIELRLEHDAHSPRTRVDPGQLEQVILNLVMNSRDAMPDGGRITIRTADAELTAADAARFPYRIVPGRYVRLSVTDTGVGMTERTLAHIFEPFFTTKSTGRGSGLGLSVAYGIIKQSGGYIWATSRAGEGARIDIYLPRVDEPVDAAEPTTDIARLPRGSGRILLVEDEAPVRTVTRRILEQGGYEVIEAGSGAEALERFEALRGAVDLVIADVVMPQMGGRELARHLHQIAPGLRILFITGYADDRRVRRPSPAGTIPLIHKPFSPERLLEQIQEMLGNADDREDGAMPGEDGSGGA